MARSAVLPLAALAVLAGCSSVTGPFGPPQGSGGGSASSSSATGTAPACMSGLGFQGSLDGHDIVLNPQNGGFVIPADNPQLPEILVADIDPGGMLVIPNFIADTSPHALALLRLPDDGPNPGVWYAFGAGTEVHLVDTDKVAFTLDSPVRLGACPGSAVDGTITYCFDSMGDTGCSGQKSTTVVTLDGKPVTWSPETVAGYLEALGDAWVGWKNEGFVVARAKGAGILSMPIHSGASFAGPYEGAILCVGSHQIGSPVSTFTDLSFLTTFGGAPPVSGTLGSCP